MSPFRRGKYWSLYVPRRSGGVVQRACGTMDRKIAEQMGRMVDLLQDQRQWDVLDALDAKTVTVPQVWDAYRMNRLAALVADANTPTLGPLRDAWLASLRNQPRTIVGYTQKITRMVPDDMKASGFTAGWCVDTLANLGVSDGTARQYLHVLSLFGDYLEGHHIIEHNPVRKRGLVRRPKNNAKRTVWHTVEVDTALCYAAPSPFREYFALVHSTGAERDAALVMRRRDIDTDAWTCHIPGTKTKTRDRKGVPIEPWAQPFLRALLRTTLPDALLFPDLTRGTVQTAHMSARKAIHRPEYQLRDARHSYAVRAILRGAPLWKVSKWLGHSNQAITAAVYTQFDLDDALVALDESADLNRYTTSHATRRA